MAALSAPRMMEHLLNDTIIQSPKPAMDLQQHRSAHAASEGSEDEVNIPSLAAGQTSSVESVSSTGYPSSVENSQSEMEIDENSGDVMGILSDREGHSAPSSRPSSPGINSPAQLPERYPMFAKQQKPPKAQDSREGKDVSKRQIDEVEEWSSDDKNNISKPIDKRPRPVDRVVDSIIGTSNSSKATRVLNEAVKDGSFVKNTAKWENFRGKILELDKEAEFDVDGDPRKVRHLRCTRVSTMGEVYNVKAFKDHLNRCKGLSKVALKKLPPKGMRSLNTFIMKPPAEALPPPKILDVFCPGLNPANVSSEQRAQIIHYMARTPASGGGAPSLDVITGIIFPERSYSDLDERERNEVRATQSQQQRWHIYSDNQKIYSTLCTKKVRIRTGTIPVPACFECTNLFKDKSFKNTLGKPIPKAGNTKFTPKHWIDRSAVEKYGRMSGLGSLLDEYTKVDFTSFYESHIVS